MARIAKQGLEYFPLDIDFFQDIRIRKLIKRQGGKAITVYALLLCLIYKNGYYMKWDDELPFIGSEISGFEQAYVSEVIKTCLSLGLFNKELFDTEEVLTSKGIQMRYCNIQRLTKRMSRIDKYSLLDESILNAHVPKQKSVTHPTKATVPVIPKPQAATEPAAAPSGPPVSRITLEVAVPQLKNDTIWSERVCKRYGLADIPQLRGLIDEFREYCITYGDTEHDDMKHVKRHFCQWLAKTKKQKQQPQPMQPQPTTSNYEYSGGFGGKDT